MANAKDRIKALADVITMQDNDHDGCAEVIQKYLLSWYKPAAQPLSKLSSTAVVKFSCKHGLWLIARVNNIWINPFYKKHLYGNQRIIYDPVFP